jgi:putative transposase
MDLIHSSHCVYHCDYHIVITTKFRKKIFNEGVFAYFDIKLAEVAEHYPYIKFKTVNHDRDHLHLLVSIPPTIQVGRVVGVIKQNTARELKQKFPFIKSVYWGTDAVWSEGYFVSTVGVNEAIIQRYIEMQGKKDAGQTKFE